MRAADFYRRGLARIEDRWSGTGQRGDRFDDAHHVYGSDLDLFGEGSLFELLCAVRTRMGEERLAEWLKSPAALDVIRQRQASVTDLKDRLDLREVTSQSSVSMPTSVSIRPRSSIGLKPRTG